MGRTSALVGGMMVVSIRPGYTLLPAGVSIWPGYAIPSAASGVIARAPDVIGLPAHLGGAPSLTKSTRAYVSRASHLPGTNFLARSSTITLSPKAYRSL